MSLQAKDVLNWSHEPDYLGTVNDCTAADFGRVAVLYGGLGPEREVSLESGLNIIQALQSLGIDAVGIDPENPDFIKQLQDGGFDRTFNILHGTVGEDGTMHGLLSLLGLATTGSDLASTALAMDKVRSKMVWQSIGLSTPAFGIASNQAEASKIQQKIGFPLVVKPMNQGSSVDTFVNIQDQAAFDKAVETVQSQYSWALIERFIPGDDLFVSIVGNRVLPSVLVRTDCDFYNYEAKYKTDDNDYISPGTASLIEEDVLAQLCLAAHVALGCSGWGRVDCRRDADGRFWLLETNTAPGMSAHSLVPVSAKVAGFSFPLLVKAILSQTLYETASETQTKAVAS